MAKYKVLVVDDDKPALTLLNIMLKRTGFEPLVAENGAEALAKLDEITPDLIICDYMLPGMNGVELIKQIRARSDTAEIPILMLSARGDQVVIIEAKEAGANDYLPKPLLMDEVTKTLTRIIEENSDKDDSEEQ